MSTSSADVPRGNFAGFLSHFHKDVLSGCRVFVIALPLCLGISLASGYPAIAGVLTAIVGAFVATFISNSELTIKGPAAGLIVIAVGCITEMKSLAEGSPDPAFAAYRMALAVGVVAGLLQIGFGIFRLGILGEFFPTSVVHGMLAAIGVIIISKQIHIVLGVMDARGEPLHLLAQIPESLTRMNPDIALIGVVSLLILFGLPLFRNKYVRRVPSQMLVILVAIPLGIYFNLSEDHTYTFAGHTFELGERYLVTVPGNLLRALAFPDFAALQYAVAWKWVAMFALIGSLESMLSAKAVDLLDPWKRKSNLDRDMLAVGIANTMAAAIGGLPMISEIVRSKANIDNGARTRVAHFWHGLFLLLCVALIPQVLHRIPLAALAAMLVYTGYRLAHPSEFIHVYRIGKEQLAIFVTTLIAVLATDLLIGIAIGILLKMVIHLANGVPLRSLFKPYLEVQEISDDTSLIVARESAVFSNWIPFRQQIVQIGLVQHRNVIVDVSGAKLVDHSVMCKLQEMRQDFEQEGLSFDVRGLDALHPFAESEYAARARRLIPLRRITVYADEQLEERLTAEFVRCGATGYTIVLCAGVGRRQLEDHQFRKSPQVRLEVIVPGDVCDAILDFLRGEVSPEHHITVSVESVDVFRVDQFAMPNSAAVSRDMQHA